LRISSSWRVVEMDLEGFARKKVLEGGSKEDVLNALAEVIGEFKEWDEAKRREFAEAVYEEVKTSSGAKAADRTLGSLFSYPRAKANMGEFGVGSRGEGDFFVHRKIAEIIGDTSALVDATARDDAGVVSGSGKYISIAIDGMHSRLSDFPFLAGFHVARAALRDIYVMGARPNALISDLHLADDGDVGKLFDFTAGVAAVSELTGVPVVAGSTLRVGGDMVFGDRLVCAVGAVGSSDAMPKVRRDADPGDVILMTEGSGGGTITTTALYNGHFDIVVETLNVDFMLSCKALLEGGLLGKIHSMTDVTNGGLRGDAWEISKTSSAKLVFYEGEVRAAVNPAVLEMLESLEVDHLGVSTDSLMLILPEENKVEIMHALERITKVYEVGRVEEGSGVEMLGEERRPLEPLFRESPYTKIKGVVGSGRPEDVKDMKRGIELASREAAGKKNSIVDFVRNQNV